MTIEEQLEGIAAMSPEDHAKSRANRAYFARQQEDGIWTVAVGMPEGYVDVNPEMDLGGDYRDQVSAKAAATNANKRFLEIDAKEASIRLLRWTSKVAFADAHDTFECSDCMATYGDLLHMTCSECAADFCLSCWTKHCDSKTDDLLHMTCSECAADFCQPCWTKHYDSKTDEVICTKETG